MGIIPSGLRFGSRMGSTSNIKEHRSSYSLEVLAIVKFIVLLMASISEIQTENQWTSHASNNNQMDHQMDLPSILFAGQKNMDRNGGQDLHHQLRATLDVTET